MIQIKKATENDAEFIAEIILLAESTGFEVTSYSQMFGLSDEDLKSIFKKIVNNPTKGHPLCIDSYFIATVDGVKAGAFSAYVEGKEGDSNHFMTGALMSGFDRALLKKGFSFLAEHKEIQIPKTKSTLQIDCVATLPEFAGKGIFTRILSFVEEKFKTEGTDTVEIQVWRKNEHAVNVYKSKGYDIFEEKKSIKDPGNGKILMRKKL